MEVKSAHRNQKWTDPLTTQHVPSLDAALLHGRPYRSRRHLRFSYCGHRWLHCPKAMVARRNWLPQSGLTSQMSDHQTVTGGKAARKWQRSRGLRKPGPELHSSSQPVSPNQEASPQGQRLGVRRPLLRHLVLRCKLFRRKSNFFACSDILCARARAMHSSSTTFMLSPCSAHFSL